MGKPKVKPSQYRRKKWKKLKSERLTALRKDEIRVKWSTREKKKLLECLHKFGSDDVDKLEVEMQTKNKEQIRYFIDRRREIAKRRATEEASAGPPPIDTWIERAKKALAQKCDYSVALIEALARTSSANEPKYKEVYGFLVGLLRNDVTTDLSKEASAIVLRLLGDLATVLHSLPLRTIQRWISYEILPPDASLRLQDNDVASFYRNGPLNVIGTSFNPVMIPSEILQYVSEHSKDSI